MGSSSQVFHRSKTIKILVKMISTQALVVSLLFAGATAQSQYRPGGDSAGGFGGSGGGSFGGGGFGDYDDAGAAGAGGDLEENIPGVPGDDYPIYAQVPDTSFLCDGQAEGGYYADVEAECQVFHICGSDGNGGLTKYSFLCPNGTLFNQQYFVCDWWFNVDCSIAETLYSLNEDIAAEREANSPAGDGQGQYAGGNGGRSGGNGRRNGSQGSSGGARRGSASSPAGSYAAPSGASPSYTFPEEFGGNGFGPADSNYGAPAGGYGAPRYEGRRRNARELELEQES